MNFSIKFNILWDSIDEKLPREEKGKSFRACIHSGNAGDIIYSLPTVKELVANHYVINLCADPGFQGRNIDFSTARALAPLLLAQPYIERVTIVSSNLPIEYLNEPIEGIDFILDKFRLQDVFKHHLSISHATAFGLYVNLYEKWLYVDGEKPDRDYVVVSLTPRYRSLPKEYWLEVLTGLDNIIVLGIPEEFHCVSGITGNFMTCDDFLQMAKIIQGSRLFIGNPNLSYAIAEGLKVPRIVELHSEFQNAYPIGQSGHIAPSTIREARELISRLLSDSESTRYYEHINLCREISHLEAAIREKDTHIGNLEIAIKDKDTYIGNLEALIKDRDTHIGNLEALIKDRDTHIGNLEALIKDRDTHIGNLEAILKDKDVHISNIEAHIKNVEAYTKGLQTHIDNVEAHARNLETHTRNLEIAVKNKDNHINNLETHITNVELHVRNLEAALRDKDIHIQNIESLLKEKETTLNNIYRSRGWKVLHTYYKLKGNILHLFRGTK